VLLHTSPDWGILVHALPYMDVMIHIVHIVLYSATVLGSWPIISRNRPYSARICHIGKFLVTLSQTRPHSLIFAHVRPNMNILGHTWLYFLYFVIDTCMSETYWTILRHIATNRNIFGHISTILMHGPYEILLVHILPFGACHSATHGHN